jgi:hydroxyacylglutathione hydrolase
MFIHQMYTSCLSEAAYYIESNGEVAIIDPIRDIQAYIDLANERGATIKYIFETHFHADFISGHLDLSSKTNAKIIFGPTAKTNYSIYNAVDNEMFILGNCSITALHTPGHTLESTCYLLKDENKQPKAIFTGDTLFVGDVGRPDLFGAQISKEELAGLLFESLTNKIITLPDEVVVYPAHGAGSSCGKNIGKETFTTIGYQKQNNYALQASTKEEFVKLVIDGLGAPPPYFELNATINKTGYDSLDLVIEQSNKALGLAEFKQETTNENVLILDTRSALQFTQSFIPNSIFIGLEGRFAEWVGNILPINKRILLVCEPNKEIESITRLSRVGYDNVIGYLQGGIDTWISANEPLDLIIDVEADELAMDIPFDNNLVVLDVRKETEYINGHVQGSWNLPLQEFTKTENFAQINEQENIYILCGGGYRSVIASSIIKKEGFHNIRNVLGGWAAVKEIASMPLVKPEKAKIIK